MLCAFNIKRENNFREREKQPRSRKLIRFTSQKNTSKNYSSTELQTFAFLNIKEISINDTFSFGSCSLMPMTRNCFFEHNEIREEVEENSKT